MCFLPQFPRQGAAPTLRHSELQLQNPPTRCGNLAQAQFTDVGTEAQEAGFSQVLLM